MSCLIVGQRATVREQLSNYYATKNSTVFQNVADQGAFGVIPKTHLIVGVSIKPAHFAFFITPE
jgi:hypothetical protein